MGNKYFQIFKNTFKYCIQTLPAFPSPQALKTLACGSPLQKALGHGKASKVLDVVFKLLLQPREFIKVYPEIV